MTKRGQRREKSKKRKGNKKIPQLVAFYDMQWETAAVFLPPNCRGVILKTIKIVVVASSLNAQHYEDSATTVLPGVSTMISVRYLCAVTNYFSVLAL